MILDRIIKGFWGRYFFYLSVFVAVYFLMREKLDSIIFGLWDRWITVGEHPRISLYLFCLLSLYPIYRILKYDKKKQMVDAAHVAYLFIPISVWYLLQRIWVTNETSRFSSNTPLYITFCFTATYSLILILLWLKRPRVDKEVESLLIKDEPIEDEKNDKLGFSLYADSISENIRNIVDNKQSFVFGIEGSWGSGKTSFINLVKANLKKDEAIRILEFNPWMSGSVQQTTTDFFSLMAESTPEMRLKMKFREYGKALASADGTGIVGKVVEGICPSQNLGAILETINGCIERQDLRFVVFIDDTDRMDKEELLAMFKLVRNTASFSNTVFVLTYDRDYVESVLKNYFKDERTAKAYPDKIINFQFELPSSTKTYYEILKEKINHSEFIKAHPDIRLNDGDLPKGITDLFDSYRKVKKVFNALVVESGLPHFGKIPVKYTLVFFYIAYYQKEDYLMMKEAYDVVKNTNWLKDHKKIGESIGQSMWRYIHESKGILGVDIKGIGRVSDTSKLKEENTKRIYALNTFKSNHQCLSSLLDVEGKNPFVKYLDFLLKLNAIHYKEYKKRYETYGINGYKGINLELSDAEKILTRLTVISKEFPKTFYEESVNELLEMFTNGEKKKVDKKDLMPYYEFIFCLLCSSNSDRYLDGLIKRIKDHYAEYNWEGKEIFRILGWIDDISNSSSNPIVEYLSNFPNKDRYNLSSSICREILYDIVNNSIKLPYKKEEFTTKANRHLRNSVNNKLDYETIQMAFYSCYDYTDPIKKLRILSKEACYRFKRYIKDYPDDFITNCILKLNGYPDDECYIVLHPFLMQIFSNSKEEVIEYFNRVSCKNAMSTFMLGMVRKYLDKYLSEKVQESPLKEFQIDKDDYDQIFNYSEEEGKEHLEPSLPASPTEVSQKNKNGHTLTQTQ